VEGEAVNEENDMMKMRKTEACIEEMAVFSTESDKQEGRRASGKK